MSKEIKRVSVENSRNWGFRGFWHGSGVIDTTIVERKKQAAKSSAQSVLPGGARLMNPVDEFQWQAGSLAVRWFWSHPHQIILDAAARIQAE